MSFYNAAIRDGSAARDLAIGYQITKDRRYAGKAIRIIDEWLSLIHIWSAVRSGRSVVYFRLLES